MAFIFSKICIIEKQLTVNKTYDEKTGNNLIF